MSKNAKKFLLANLENFSPKIKAAVKLILSDLEKSEEKIIKLEKNLYGSNDLPNEIWKDIKGYEGIYQISNLGRVKSLRWAGGKIMKVALAWDSYYVLKLQKNGESKTPFVHVLVAQAFIPNPENKPQVNHIDGNKLNNRADNLEWVTASENLKHAIKLGLQKVRSGTKNGFAKLTEDDVRYIRNNFVPYKRGNNMEDLAKKFNDVRYIRNNFVPYKRGNNMEDLAKKFNVHVHTIRNVIIGKSYKNVK